MEYITLIKNVRIPLLGFGTWEMGGRYKKDTSNDATCIEAIKTAIQLGMTHIDTAELYGNGHAEELVAQAIQNLPREKLFITSKVKSDHLAYDDVIAACQR